MNYKDVGLGDPGTNREWILTERDDGRIDAVLFDRDSYTSVTRRVVDNPESNKRESAGRSQDDPIVMNETVVTTKRDIVDRADVDDALSPPIARFQGKEPTLPSSPLERIEGPSLPPELDIQLSRLGVPPVRPKEPIGFASDDMSLDDVDLMDVDIDDLKPPSLPSTKRFQGEEFTSPSSQLERIDRQTPFDGPLPESVKYPSAIIDQPAELPMPVEEESVDIKKVEISPTITDAVIRSQKAIGSYESPPGEVVVTGDALEEVADPSPQAPYKLVIDPNNNTAEILDAIGTSIEQFQVGTGDTTGTRYGKKYFSPTGFFKVKDEVPMAGGSGYEPLWMGLTQASNLDQFTGAPITSEDQPYDVRYTYPKLGEDAGKGYGLHGPHKQGDKAEGGGFENEGFISHGCLRFTEDDILRVGEYLDVGSSVEILPYDTRPLHRGALRIK